MREGEGDGGSTGSWMGGLFGIFGGLERKRF